MYPIDFVCQRSKVKFTIDMYMYGNKLVNTIDLNVVCLFIELGKHVNHGETQRMNSIDFGGYRSKVNFTMCIIDKIMWGAQECYDLCCYILNFETWCFIEVVGWFVL